MKKLFLAGTAFTAMYAAQAQKELKTTSINLFKNGTYFVVKEGNVDAPKGYWSMPMQDFNPLLSTFWINTTRENPVERIEYTTDTIATTRLIGNYHDALNANRGKKVKLTYTIGANGTNVSNVKGTLENFYPLSGIAKIKTPEGSYLFLNTSNIYELFFDESPNEKIKTDSLAMVARVYFGREKKNMPVKLSYMQSGMSWVPSYSIRVIDDGKLQLSMNALIENYSEDINNTDLTITLGAANFKYGAQLDPLVQRYVSATGLVTNYNPHDNNYNYQATYSNVLPAREMQLTNGYELADISIPYNDYTNYVTTGDKNEDLYRYKLGKVSLAKNSKATFPIFAADIPYESVYEVNISDVINYAGNQYINNNDNQVYDVFHSLKLSNTTGFPFTTAPVFIQDKNLQPLAQDQIKYTPTGAKVNVQLAKATDVMVKNVEEEESNEPNARKYNGHSYALVTIKGTIRVENLQPKEIKLNISKTINGNIKSVSDNGTIKKSGRYNELNPSSSGEWVFNVARGEKKTITYTYEVYVYR